MQWLLPLVAVFIAASADAGPRAPRTNRARLEAEIHVARRPSSGSLYKRPAFRAMAFKRAKVGETVLVLHKQSGHVQRLRVKPGEEVKVLVPASEMPGLRDPYVRLRYDHNVNERVHDIGTAVGLPTPHFAERTELTTGGQTSTGLHVEFKRVVRVKPEGERTESVGLVMRGQTDLSADIDKELLPVLRTFAGSLEILKVRHALTGKAKISYKEGEYRYFVFKGLTLAVHESGKAMEVWVSPGHDRVWSAGDETGFLAPVLPPVVGGAPGQN